MTTRAEVQVRLSRDPKKRGRAFGLARRFADLEDTEAAVALYRALGEALELDDVDDDGLRMSVSEGTFFVIDGPYGVLEGWPTSKAVADRLRALHAEHGE